MRALALCGLIAQAGATAGAGPAPDLADLEAQVEYAYYAADLRALDELARAQPALAATGRPWAAYQAAHLAFRQARLRRDRGDAAGATEAARACLRALDGAPAAPEPAETDVLAAACGAYAGGRPGTIERRLKAAAAAAPHNPRLLLARAYATVAALPARPSPGERQEALTRARGAAEAFAIPRAAEDGAPSWGAAEAWLLLATRAEADNDWLVAREAYERSLVVAPHYALARSRLAALVARAR